MKEIDMQTGISSIDMDREGRHLAVGGREILKIIDIEQQNKNMNIKWNLRRQGTKLAIGYVEFNKELPNYLLAASVQGHFQIWDLEKQKEDVYKCHTAAIHRMNWQNAHCFISGGQDYQIYYYDYRQSKEKQIFSIQRNEAIRDIKFNINDKNYFMASNDSGLLEYFDIRKQSKNEIPLTWKQSNSSSMIICLDWAKDNILASGSTEKEIKIWQVEGHTEIREKVNIQHVDGTSHLKWHQKNSSLLSVSSLNRDFSVTTYDIRTPYRPLYVIKGHSDTINTFVYDQEEQYLLTGSKDKLLKMQSVKDSYKVYENCPIYPVCFNQQDDLLFKLESPSTALQECNKMHTVYGISKELYKQSSQEDNPILKSKTQIPFSQQTPLMSSQQDIYRATSVTPSVNQNQTVTVRSICLIQTIDQQLEPRIPFEEELKYFQKNYNSQRDFQYNSTVAQKIEKQEVAHYWKALEHLMNDFLKLAKEFQNVQVKCPIQMVKERSSQNDFSDDDQKFPLEQPLPIPKNKYEKKQLEWQDLQKLYKYFEKYPAAFRQELESKNIIIEDQNHLKIHIERIPYYKNLLRTMTPLGQLLTDKQQMMKVISNSILQLIQHVIDQGELQSGFWMAACAKNFVTFPEAIAKKWTLSFIELLVAFGKNTFAMKAVLESPVEEIRKSNQYSTNYKCIGPCKMNQASAPSCSVCRQDIICSICFKPVKGLYLWCQKCMHGGHMKEMKEWFKSNTHCPMGCGDQCFEK